MKKIIGNYNKEYLDDIYDKIEKNEKEQEKIDKELEDEKNSIFYNEKFKNLDDLKKFIIIHKNDEFKISDFALGLEKIYATTEEAKELGDWIKKENINYIDDTEDDEFEDDDNEEIDEEDIEVIEYVDPDKHIKDLLPTIDPEVKNQLELFPLSKKEISEFSWQKDQINGHKLYYVYSEHAVSDNKVLHVGITDDPNYEYTVRIDPKVLMFDCLKGLKTEMLIGPLSIEEAEMYYISKLKEYRKKKLIMRDYIFTRGCPNDGEVKIVKDNYIQFYFPDIYSNDDDNGFDHVDDESLTNVCFLNKQKSEVVKLLLLNGSKITKNPGKNTKSIIICEPLLYSEAFKYKHKGLKVLSCEDIEKYLNCRASNTSIIIKKRHKSYDAVVRSFIRDFFKRNENEINEYIIYMNNEGFPVKDWIDPFRCKILKDCDPSLYAGNIGKLIIIDALKEKIQAAKDSGPYYYAIKSAIKFYNNNGMFEESINLLKNNNDLYSDYIKSLEFFEGDKDPKNINYCTVLEDNHGSKNYLFICKKCQSLLNTQNKYSLSSKFHICESCNEYNDLTIEDELIKEKNGEK